MKNLISDSAQGFIVQIEETQFELQLLGELVDSKAKQKGTQRISLLYTL